MIPSRTKQRGRIDSIGVLSGVGLLLALAALAYNLWQMSIAANWDERYRVIASDIRQLSQEINVAGGEATSGQEAGFKRLAESQARVPSQITALREGELGLPAPGPSMNVYLARLDTEWGRLSPNIDTLISARERIMFIRQVSAELNSNIKTIQAHYADLVDILLDQPVSKTTLLAGQQQLWLIERIGRNIDRILQGGANAQTAAEEFKQDALRFQLNMEGMRDGDRSRDIDALADADAIASLELADALYQSVNGSVEEIYNAYPEMIAATEAATVITESAPLLAVVAGDALSHVDQLASERPLTSTTATYAGGIASLLLLLILFRMNGTRNQERQAQAQADLNEAEVAQKVLEIEPLAEGNLSQDLSETDGITQPIAVAINQLLAWMREVVTSVNNSSHEVNEAVEESAQASGEVKSSLEEVGSIVADTASTSSELSLINNHMAELAQTTDQASDQAVSAARQGGDGIQTLMVSVEEIRDSQQTVAKTSKRLGDDIEIVADLLFKIREVANAISTLAMNTRIEAASYSGEGGQRFAGIADETGKLANQTNDIVQEADRAIRSVSNRMAESNRNMEGATQSLVKLTDIASDVSEHFEKILSLSENTRKYMGDMRQQIQQSSQSSGRVTESVSDILEKTLATQRAAGRMDSATDELRMLFDRLRDDTGRFMLEQNTSELTEEDKIAVYPFHADATADEEADDTDMIPELEQKAG